jgi:hypothetical protein
MRSAAASRIAAETRCRREGYARAASPSGVEEDTDGTAAEFRPGVKRHIVSYMDDAESSASITNARSTVAAEVNVRIAAMTQDLLPGATEAALLCECGSEVCRDMASVSLVAYNRLRECRSPLLLCSARSRCAPR